jgi:hypothetical protein
VTNIFNFSSPKLELSVSTGQTIGVDWSLTLLHRRHQSDRCSTVSGIHSGYPCKEV